MAFSQGAPGFGLNDVKIQTWASAGTYSGSITDVMSAQALRVTLEFSEAQLTGDDAITATAARAIGGSVQMRFGGLNTDALAILMGRATSTISGVIQQSVKGGNRMPYVGIIGKQLVEEGSGDVWCYIPKAKIMGNFNLIMMEYGTFDIPEVTLRLVDDASYGVINWISHPTDVAITVMPPANIAVVSS